MNSKTPKYQNQQEMLNKIDNLFYKVLKKRDKIIKKNCEMEKDIIKSYDLRLSMYIKKRAKITKGGYNFIPEEMWSWEPHFHIDERLLPKIIRNLSEINKIE
tara:strand:+ start:273 stop:578 length:306 start_codon:yes stop_codon:yes gene_type:complete